MNEQRNLVLALVLSAIVLLGWALVSDRVFPTANKRRSSAFRRATVRQWFDVASLADPARRPELQYQGLAESALYIRSILKRELECVPRANVVLGGLSQGCAMALAVLLSLEFPLGGFVGMSGWLPFRDDLDGIMQTVSTGSSGSDDVFAYEEGEGGGEPDPSIMAINLARDILSMDELGPLTAKDEQTCLATPVLLCHGEEDEKVRYELGESAAGTLSSLGMQVSWNGYPGLGHWYQIPEEIDDIVKFLRGQVGWL